MLHDIFEKDIVHDVFAAWDVAKTARRDVPSRADFDPLQCPGSLSHIWIYERKTADFECVLAGEKVNDSWGKRILGRNLIDVIGRDAHQDAVNRFNSVLDNCWLVHGFFNQEYQRKAERFYAPLTNSDCENSYVLGVSFYYDRPKNFGNDLAEPNQNICDFVKFYDGLSYQLIRQINL